MTGVVYCPSGYEETGSCVSGGSSGICCLATGECAGKSDLESCTDGICCYGECVATTGTECCSSLDCGVDENCEGNMCIAEPGEGFDLTLIIIIIAIAAAGGAGAWFFLKKYRKGKSAEEGFEEKKDEDVFDEEEFY